jgi:cell filamentation protein
VYAWAGEIRTVNIAKDGLPFYSMPFIEQQLYEQFAGLAEEHHLIGLTKDTFVTKFAMLYGEMNAIHPVITSRTG